MSEDKHEKSFQVSQPAKLIVSNICGSVEILPGEDGTILLTAVKHINTGDGKRTEIEIAQEADGTVKAATHFPDGSWSWLFGSRPCDVDYIVKVPRNCSLRLTGVSSTASAEGIEGACIVKSVSGDISLHDMTGAMQIHTISGEIDGKSIFGPLDLDTVSGDAVLMNSNLPSIKSRTVSGNIQIQTPLAGGPYHFKSISGDVRLIVPTETRCTAELHSVSGDLISAFPFMGNSHNHGIQTININGGGGNISLNSVSGNLSLDSDGKFPPIPAPARSTYAEGRHKVLEGIARGEMTVEEGLIKLKG